VIAARRSAAALLSGLSLLAALALVSCSEEPAPRSSPDESPFAGSPPSEGTIAFHEPRARVAGARKTRVQPTTITITITTQARRGHAADDPVGTGAGGIAREGAAERPTEPDVRRKIAEEARLRSAYVTSPARFRELWAALEQVGVFKLPRARGGAPPEDQPSILMTAGGRTWVFLRPDLAPEEVLSKKAEEIREIQAIWGQAKILIVSFHP